MAGGTRRRRCPRRAILDLLAALRLAERDWITVDHWDADLEAIGIARASEPRRLVYVSTYGRAPGAYYFESESPTGRDATEYSVAESGEVVGIDALRAALHRHLSRPTS